MEKIIEFEDFAILVGNVTYIERRETGEWVAEYDNKKQVVEENSYSLTVNFVSGNHINRNYKTKDIRDKKYKKLLSKLKQ